MDPLIGNGIDPGLLRVVDKRGQERDPELRRRRAPAPGAGRVKEEGQEQGPEEKEQEPEAEAPKHELDDLA